jgi:hypothetical protein
MQEFFNPKSMLTPGIAGGLTVTISMAIITAFDLKFPLVSLIISFLFGLLVVLPLKEKIIVRALYCILNTLIIFSVSFGTGKNIDRPPTPISTMSEVTKSINPLEKMAIPSLESPNETKAEYTMNIEKYNHRWSW